MFLSDLHQSGRLGAYPSEILEFYFGTGFVKIKFQDFLGLDWALKLLLNSYFNMTFTCLRSWERLVFIQPVPF